MKNILQNNNGSLALVIGNGINLYHQNGTTNSWSQLLETLASKNRLPLSNNSSPIPFSRLIQTITLTEFYDLLEMKAPKSKSSFDLQTEFCELLAHWKPQHQHFSITEWARAYDVPILTTNFDNTLSAASSATLRHLKNNSHGFTSHYPWSSYYAPHELSSPMHGYGIWHINGMRYYPNSIRLGLTHYMGSVERARKWLYDEDDEIPFEGKNRRNWAGLSTWLHVIFNKPLLIFGLGLSSTEVFLRWLLIERARYFKEFPERYKQAWFVCPQSDLKKGQAFFLEGVGIEVIQTKSFGEIYDPDTWNLIQN